jgi:hypothetical protein
MFGVAVIGGGAGRAGCVSFRGSAKEQGVEQGPHSNVPDLAGFLGFLGVSGFSYRAGRDVRRDGVRWRRGPRRTRKLPRRRRGGGRGRRR